MVSSSLRLPPQTQRPHSGSHLLAAVAFALLGLTSTTTAETTYCNAGLWDVGNGYNCGNWFSSGFNYGSACTTMWNSQSFVINWDISQYGFLHGVGRNTFWKNVDNCNSSAVAYHDHNLVSYRANSDAYTGLYGWHTNWPAAWDTGIEWYIIEDWMVWKPWPGSANWKGNITLDGDNYDIYNVKGGSYGKWDQWWSIRTNKRLKGNISYIQHFKKWRQLGMPNQIVHDVKFALESNGGSTKGQVNYNWISIGEP